MPELKIMGAEEFKKDGEPVWDQMTIDRLWVTTQREAMIESGPPAATNAPATQQGTSAQGQKAKAPAKKNWTEIETSRWEENRAADVNSSQRQRTL